MLPPRGAADRFRLAFDLIPIMGMNIPTLGKPRLCDVLAAFVLYDPQTLTASAWSMAQMECPASDGPGEDS
jgi:hypothetical protein